MCVCVCVCGRGGRGKERGGVSMCVYTCVHDM